jgi:sortase A
VSVETPASDDESGPPTRSRHAVATSTRATRSTGDWVRLGFSGLGQVLITCGVIVLLFVVYEVWITNIFSDAKQHDLRTHLIQEWAAPTPTPAEGGVTVPSVLPDGVQANIPVGSGVAVIYIPRFGQDYSRAIVEGTDDASLSKGPGHYLDTQLPGQIGNFAVAGHRVGKGEPFLNLDKLRPGDPIVIETKTTWFVYLVKGDKTTGNLSVDGADGIPGRTIVNPSDGQVILPVPNHPSAKPTEALMTLTTCDPKFTATQRMIVFSALARTVARQGNTLPTELGGSL